MAASTASSDQVSALAEQYARALFELSQERKEADRLAGELDSLCSLLDSQPQLAQLFAHRSIDEQRRAATIDRIFSGRVSQTLLHFLQVLNRKGRLDELRSITSAFRRLFKQALGQVDVDVYTAQPMQPADSASVADRLTAAIGRQALLREHVDPALIGGIKIRVGDRLIDGSIASRLRRLKRQIQENGHEHMRRSAGRLIQE